MISNFGRKEKVPSALKLVLSRLTDRLDIIIYGATGFQGKHTVREAATLLQNYTWGVAGRNKVKVATCLAQIAALSRSNILNKPIFEANTKNMKSLKKMTSKCHVLINCSSCYGNALESIINACLLTRTHYVDICTDVHFLELLQLKYHEEAKRRNVYIIFACGFNSLPIDVGINFLQENFEGTVNAVEACTCFYSATTLLFTPIISKSLWNNYVYNWQSIYKSYKAHNLVKLREFRDLKPKNAFRYDIHESQAVGGFSVAYPVLDQQIVENSQYYIYKMNNTRPVQLNNYIAFTSFLVTFAFILWSITIALLAQIKFMRTLMMKCPRIFSLGYVSNKDPNEFSCENISFEITLNGIGWAKEYITNPIECNRVLRWGYPNRRLTLKINGANPFYRTSCICVLASALTILHERNQMPSVGGVYFPGAAFKNTDIVTVLDSNGLSFETYRQPNSKF